VFRSFISFSVERMKRDTFSYYMANERVGIFFFFSVTGQKEVNIGVYFLSFQLTQKVNVCLH
jgi:hypothetical protein